MSPNYVQHMTHIPSNDSKATHPYLSLIIMQEIETIYKPNMQTKMKRPC